MKEHQRPRRTGWGAARGCLTTSWPVHSPGVVTIFEAPVQRPLPRAGGRRWLPWWETSSFRASATRAKPGRSAVASSELCLQRKAILRGLWNLSLPCRQCLLLIDPCRSGACWSPSPAPRRACRPRKGQTAQSLQPGWPGCLLQLAGRRCCTAECCQLVMRFDLRLAWRLLICKIVHKGIDEVQLLTSARSR